MLKKLSKEIFSKELDDLDPIELKFVRFQAQAWKAYKREMAVLLREVEGKGKLSTHEYEFIDEMFLKRVTPYDFKAGVKNGVKYAKKVRAPLFSAGFFRPHILALHMDRERKIKGNLFMRVDGVDFPWLYIFFKFKEQGQFNSGGRFGAYKYDVYYGFK